MLAFMRAFAKTWYAKLLFVVLIVSFGFFGVRDMVAGRVANDVVSAGSRSVSMAEFKMIFDRQKKQIEEQQNQGQPVSIEELVKAGVPTSIADQLATKRALNAWLDKIGVKPADTLVAAELRQVPDFFNPVTGQFDKKAYEDALANQGLTVAQFERDQGDNIALQHFVTGLASGLRAPRIYTAFQAAYLGEGRDLSWITVDNKMAGVPTPPTDAQLQAFINEHAEPMRRPELRTATLALFLPAEVAKTIQADPDRVKKLYDFRKDTMSKPETRTWVKVVAPNAQAAAAIADGLKAGGDPIALAKAKGGQAVPNQDRPKTAEPDATVANTVFSMKAGDVSDPIHGTLGWAVVKLTGVNPGVVKTFEQAKPELEAQVKVEAARAKVDDMVQKFEEARAKGMTLAQAAQLVGAPTKTMGPMTRQGATQENPQGGLPKPITDGVFSVPKGSVSEVLDLGQGSYFAAQVDEVTPPALPNLAVAKDRALVAGFWMQSEQVKRLQAKASELAARLKKGESLQAVAASVGAKIETASDLRRAGARQNPMVGPAFTHALGESFSTPTPTGTYVVGKVDAIHPIVPTLVARQAEQARPAVSQEIFGDMATGVQSGARDAVKAKVDKQKIDQAIGVADTAGKKK